MTAFHALAGAYLRREPGRSLLTILGVALGVAVLVAIDLAIDSAVTSFRNTLRDVAGSATLVVRANTSGLPPQLVSAVLSHPGVVGAAPLIEGEALFMPPGSDRPQPMLLLGVDLLATSESFTGSEAEPIRELKLELDRDIELSRFLTDPDLFATTASFARRNHLRPGETVLLSIAGRQHPMRIGALVEGGPWADAMGGAVAVVDLGIADALLGRRGLLDRIDIATAPQADLEKVSPVLESMLPPTAVVERPEARGEQTDAMLAAFRFNLEALGQISLLVGAFLIFNTMSVAVRRRTQAIGTVRALGLSARAVRWVFLLEAALLSLAGGVIGVIGGIFLAWVLLEPIAAAISINFFTVRAGDLAPFWWPSLRALVLGLAFAGAAAHGPAAMAARVAPANTMRRGSLDSNPRRLRWMGWLGLAAACLAILLLKAEASQGIPYLGYSMAACVIAAFVCWARPLLALTTRLIEAPLVRILGGEGLVALASTRAALGRSGVAISGLLIALAMTISIGVMVASFRQTVVVWMHQVLRADIYVRPATTEGSVHAEPMPDEIAHQVAALPGVRAVDPFRMLPITMDGVPAWLGAGRFDVVRYDPSLRILDGRPAQQVLRQARAMDGAIVSEAFARKRGIDPGDKIEIAAPAGPLRLPVAGIYFDYSTERGYVIIDRELFLRHFGDSRIDSLAIYLEDDADPEAVRSEIERVAASLPGLPRLAIRYTQELRNYALDAFNRTFRITWAMEVIAMVIAMLGVANTLLAQILDRRDEIETLRTLGVSRASVARVVVIESGIIGLVGVAAGVAAGLALAWILARVIMLQSFGWTIQFDIPWGTVLQMAGLVLLSTLMAGALPAREATRLTRATPGTVSA